MLSPYISINFERFVFHEISSFYTEGSRISQRRENIRRMTTAVITAIITAMAGTRGLLPPPASRRIYWYVVKSALYINMFFSPRFHVQCTWYVVHCIRYAVHCTVYNILYSVHYIIQCTLFVVYYR